MKSKDYSTITGFDSLTRSGFIANKRAELPKHNVYNTDSFYDTSMDMWMVWAHHGSKQTKYYLIKDKRLF